MKKFIFGFLSAILLSIFISADIIYQANKKTAEVESVKGILVFTSCKPVTPYKYLGSIKVLTVMGQYHEEIPALTEKAKKKYPTADAIIYTSKESADVIMFE